MSPTELAEAASAALAKGLEKVQFVVPRRAGGGRRVRVLGGKGLKSVFGELCCENSEGHAVVWVDALDVLAWLAANGFVKVEVSP